MSAQPETLAQLTESIREIRETLQDNGKWREESDRRREEADRRYVMLREEADRRYDQLMEKSRLEYNRQAEEYNRKFAELVEQTKETDRRMKETDKRVGGLSSSVGEIVEHMIGGDNILAQFQALGYDVNDHYRNRKFGIKNTNSSGQIDMILEDGDVAILIEVKTNLKNDDVLEHIERLEKYRRWMDSKGHDRMRYVGALACAMVEDSVVKFAQKNGMYVIVQLGNTVEIVSPPEGFKAKEW